MGVIYDRLLTLQTKQKQEKQYFLIYTKPDNSRYASTSEESKVSSGVSKSWRYRRIGTQYAWKKKILLHRPCYTALLLFSDRGHVSLKWKYSYSSAVLSRFISQAQHATTLRAFWTSSSVSLTAHPNASCPVARNDAASWRWLVVDEWRPWAEFNVEDADTLFEKLLNTSFEVTDQPPPLKWPRLLRHESQFKFVLIRQNHVIVKEALRMACNRNAVRTRTTWLGHPLQPSKILIDETPYRQLVL